MEVATSQHTGRVVEVAHFYVTTPPQNGSLLGYKTYSVINLAFNTNGMN